MSEGMWFLLGVLCGAVIGGAVAMSRKGKAADVEKSVRSATEAGKTWAQTRNFLYYDGTRMPEIKEDLNE